MLQAVDQLVDDIFVHAQGKGESILVINSPFVAVSLPCICDMIIGSAMMFSALILILRMKQKYKQQKPSSALPKLFAASCYKLSWIIFNGLFSVNWEEFYFSD